MYFLRVKVTFDDVGNMIDDVIGTSNSFPYTAKLTFVAVRNNKFQQISR